MPKTAIRTKKEEATHRNTNKSDSMTAADSRSVLPTRQVNIMLMWLRKKYIFCTFYPLSYSFNFASVCDKRRSKWSLNRNMCSVEPNKCL